MRHRTLLFAALVAMSLPACTNSAPEKTSSLMPSDIVVEMEIYLEDNLRPEIEGQRWEAILSRQEQNFFAMIEPKHPPVQRGQAFLADVSFLNPSGALPYFEPGADFTIKAVGEVGRGTVISEAIDESG